jgi:hypothetical protein
VQYGFEELSEYSLLEKTKEVEEEQKIRHQKVTVQNAEEGRAEEKSIENRGVNSLRELGD